MFKVYFNLKDAVSDNCWSEIALKLISSNMGQQRDE